MELNNMLTELIKFTILLLELHVMFSIRKIFVNRLAELGK